MRSEKEIRGWHDDLKNDLDGGPSSVEQAIGTNAALTTLKWVLSDPEETP